MKSYNNILVALCYVEMATTRLTPLACFSLASLSHTCKPETFFFPVFRLVDSSPNDFLHEILRISSVYAVCIFNCSVRHDLKSKEYYTQTKRAHGIRQKHSERLRRKCQAIKRAVHYLGGRIHYFKLYIVHSYKNRALFEIRPKVKVSG